MTEEELIKACLGNNTRAMRLLYDRFAPVMYAICLRYMRNTDDARDVLQEGFVRVFDRLGSFRGEGSFEGWMKRIFVNYAINQYHKHKKNLEHEFSMEQLPDTDPEETDALDRISEKELLQLISTLPTGYRMVFNLYVLEGYTHDEIATMLNIKSTTSRTQLLKARNMLRNKLNNLNHEIRERSL